MLIEYNLNNKENLLNIANHFYEYKKYTFIFLRGVQ